MYGPWLLVQRRRLAAGRDDFRARSPPLEGWGLTRPSYVCGLRVTIPAPLVPACGGLRASWLVVFPDVPRGWGHPLGASLRVYVHHDRGARIYLDLRHRRETPLGGRQRLNEGPRGQPRRGPPNPSVVIRCV